MGDTRRLAWNAEGGGSARRMSPPWGLWKVESHDAKHEEEAAIRMPHCERAACRRVLALGLRGSFGPLPQTVRHIGREAMAELARHQHDLAAVMAFMSDEVGQHMPHVER